MRPLLAVPFVFSLIAWTLTLCALLAGKTGMRGYYAVGFNTSKAGIDLLTTTNLFNFDESNVLFTLLYPNGVNVPSYGNADAAARAANQKVITKRQTGSMPALHRLTNMISGPMDSAWDQMADRYKIDRDGFVYGAVKRTLAKTTTNVENETANYLARIQDILYRDVTGSINEEFGKLTAGLPIPSGMLVPKPVIQRAVEDEDFDELDKRSEHMSEVQRRAMIQEVQGEQIKKILMRDLANVPTPKPGSTVAGLLDGTNLSALAGGAISTGVGMATGYTDGFVKELSNPASTNLVAVVVKDSGPYISWAVRDFVNSLVNDNMQVIRRGFSVQDYYAFYQSRFCYGNFQGSKRQQVGCHTTAWLQNANMAPRVNNTVKLYGGNRQVPKSMPLGKNLEDSIAGTKSFTAAIWTVDVSSSVLAGLATFAALIGMIMPHKFERLVDMIGIWVTIGSGIILLLSCSLNFLLVQAIHLILPGALATLNIGNTEGWKYVTLLFVGLIMESIAIAFWVWLGIRNIRARAILSVTPSAPVSHTHHTSSYSPTSTEKPEVVHKD